ncbi:MAG: type I-U CRISPR-associated RAMP protein Csb1/Cas7u [Armatimonadota bacterium]
MQVTLQPLQVSRFQPTGFPDQGAAIYKTGEGQQLLVESEQSMSNRLEAVCWDDAAQDVIAPLRGISYVRVERGGEFLTSSILEAHRLDSFYILNNAEFKQRLRDEMKVTKEMPIDFLLMARVLLRYDCNCLVHGVFLEDIDGRLSMPRSLSAFIEATGVRVATSGGVKKDHISPTGGTRPEGPTDQDDEAPRKSGAKEGRGHVPYSREEYTADEITAYFNLDLSQIRACGLAQSAQELLTTMALYKVRRFLREGLRLRTACDLEAVGPVLVKRPSGWQLPELDVLEADLPNLIAAVAAEGRFTDPPVTTVEFTG